MSTSVGTIYYEVDAKTSGLLRAEKEIDQSTRRMEDSTKRVDSGFNKIAASVKRATAAIVSITAATQAVRSVVRQTMEFEQSLLGIQAVSGATASQMQELEKQARQLGATTVFSAKQAADAQGFLARAGFSVNEIMSATPGILELAVAGEMDLARAADIASNVLAGMRMEVSQLNRVNDVLAATAASANTSVSQLGDGFSYAAPLAAGLNVSLEEAGAAIAAVSDAGIQASRAGTAVGAVFRQLTRITPQSEKVLRRYGLTTEDLRVSQHGLIEVMRRLRRAGLDEADMFQVFGTEAGAAAQILINSTDKVADLTKELENAEGAASRMAQILGSGLTASLKGFGSAVSEAVLVLGRDSGFSGALQTVLDTSAGVINNLSGMTMEMSKNADVSNAQRIVIQGLADALRILALVAAGRVVGALGSVVAAKLAATQQAIAYQMALGRMAGVTATAAAAQLSLAAATRAVTAAFWMMGGPAGAVALAAYGIYHFREELGLVDSVAEAADAALQNLTKAIKDGDDAALNSSYEALTLELQSIQVEAQAAMQALLMLERQERMQSGAHEGIAEQTRQRIAQMNQEMAGMWARMAEIESARKRIEARRAELASGSGTSEEDEPGKPGRLTTPDDDAAKRREREFQRLQQQLDTEREAIEREYKERTRIIRENTAEGSQQQLDLLKRSGELRLDQLRELEQRATSLVATESERIVAEYEERERRIRRSLEDGSEAQQRALERNNEMRERALAESRRNELRGLISHTEAVDAEYERQQRAILERTKEGSEERARAMKLAELQHLEAKMAAQNQDLAITAQHHQRVRDMEAEHYALMLQQLHGFSEQAARKMAEIRQRASDPMRALTDDLHLAFVSLDDTISSAFMRGMQDGQSFNNILSNIGQTVLGSLLQSFIKLGVQMALNAAMGSTYQQMANAQAVVGGKAALAAWKPAAIAASIATFGSAAAMGKSAYMASQAAGAGGFMSQIATGPGRRRGGPVYPGVAHPVTEDGRPELLTQGTRSYLIPGRGGRVTRHDEIGGDASLNLTVNLVEDASRAGQVEQSRSEDGSYSLRIAVADIHGNGPLAKTLQGTYGLRRRRR